MLEALTAFAEANATPCCLLTRCRRHTAATVQVADAEPAGIAFSKPAGSEVAPATGTPAQAHAPA